VERIFHIAERDAWMRSVELGRYVAASLGDEGSIHCSTRAQVLATASRYYRGRSGLMLLCIDPERLSSRVEYEAPVPIGEPRNGTAREGLFPHVYGPIDVHALTRVVELEPNGSGEFEWPVAEEDPMREPAGSDRASSPGGNVLAKNARIEAFWAEFCQRSRLAVATPYQAWHFGDSSDLAHELADLVVHGPKRATATLLWSVERCPELAPIPNAYSVVTELDGVPRAVIRTTRVEVRAFDAVDAEFAWDEGEDDRSLEAWRAGHLEYFSRQCVLLGRTPRADMPVVLERFELLHGGA
jgi:uncharacterized protein YhfF/uncharacterized protein (DUF952 family)